jgi:hypothetical protein
MRRPVLRIAPFAAIVLVLVALGQVSYAQKGAYGNADAITEDVLKQHLYFLASDELEGRNSPSRGYDTAALYIATHVKEWGLKPGGGASAAGGPLQAYLVPLDLVSNQIDPDGMKLSLNIPMPAAGAGRGGLGGGAAAPGLRSFDYGRDWTVGAGGGGRGGASVPAVDIKDARIVFVGHGYVINKSNTNPYQGLDVKGKIMVVAGLPAELAAARTAPPAGGGRGAAAPNPLGVENTDYVTPQGFAAKNGAAGIVMIPTFQQLSAMAAPPAGRGAGPNGPAYQVVKFQTSSANVPVITAGAGLTNAIFQGEKLNGTQVFEGATSNAKLDPFELGAEKKLTLKTGVNALKAQTSNVMAILEGSDPVLKNEFVVFSAHLDHVGFSAGAGPDGDRINNGADDDGSGSVALMAIARAFAQGAQRGQRPKRSMIFLWVTGEEKGLWGSRYFCQFPPVDISKVVANLNIDMIGRSKPAGYKDPPQYKLVEPGEVFVVGPDISSADMGKIVSSVAAAYGKLKINPFYDTVAPTDTRDNLGPQPNGQRIFYRSDHYNFARMGIPVAFYTTGLHTDYHRVSDHPDKIDYASMALITKNVAAVGWVVANQAARPKINAKLPDQLVNDMKTAQEAGWGKLTPIGTK